MNIEGYIEAQRANLESIKKLPHFSILVSLMNQLYDRSFSLVPRNSEPLYGQFLLICHKSFLSATTLIAQAQPEDSAAISRRAIEIARICLACKYKMENLEKWRSYEQRMLRWKEREEGKKPKPFFPSLNFPPGHALLKDLERDIGMLSDSYVHFTPEYLGSQNWKKEKDAELVTIKLNYFTSDQKTIEREFILLVGTHIKILRIFDECLDSVFSKNKEWQTLMGILGLEGMKLSKDFKR